MKFAFAVLLLVGFASANEGPDKAAIEKAIADAKENIDVDAIKAAIADAKEKIDLDKIVKDSKYDILRAGLSLSGVIRDFKRVGEEISAVTAGKGPEFNAKLQTLFEELGAAIQNHLGEEGTADGLVETLKTILSNFATKHGPEFQKIVDSLTEIFESNKQDLIKGADKLKEVLVPLLKKMVGKIQKQLQA